MPANAYLQIDLQAIVQNAREIQREIGPGTKLIPVLKGNAYGTGAVRAARALAEIPGIDTFAVSQAAEGIQLREAGISQQILVMSLVPEGQMEDAANADLVLTLGSFFQFPLLERLARKTGRKIPVSLKLDTGLHRIGFVPGETEALCRALLEARDALEIRGTFSHYAECGTDASAEQERVFYGFLESLRSAGIDPGLCHMGSSASVEDGMGLGLDAVRAGRRLFLDSPIHPTGKIREAFSLHACLTDVRERKAGELLGYGGKVRLETGSRIGVISIGYGDGLDPALAAARAPVLVNGRRAELLVCCMDQSLVRLGDIPASPGDTVTVFGKDPTGERLSSQEVAGLIGCEGVDLTSRLTNRVERVYTN